MSKTWQQRAYINDQNYRKLYQQSLENPEVFWSEQAQRINWFKKFHTVQKTQFTKPIDIQWFIGGKLNACFNCVDRHLPLHADKVAFFWEPDDPHKPGLAVTYEELHDKVQTWARALSEQGVKKGDRVTIYLPMIPEAIFSLLACARIGAVHSVVFAGFSPDSLADRIQDCESEYLITADEGWRGGKTLALKNNADKAVQKCPDLKKMFVVKHTGGDVTWQEGRDFWYHELCAQTTGDFPCAEMDAEDPLFILYTSGSTSKPKGVLHTTGGYMVYASLSHHYVFDYHPEDIYWCAADIGWVTGHSYTVYGPMSNAASQVIFEGVPTWPSASRLWEVVDKYQVNILYTAPTLLRALMQKGDEPLEKTSRQSLKLLGSVGEPINPEAWLWYHQKAGRGECPIVDTWWQTETGGIMITPLPGATPLKPGSAAQPFFGVQLEIVDNEGRILEGACEGQLCIVGSWPGQMRGVYKNPERFFDTYFSQYPGKYFTGDGCRRDDDGYYWITGRVDDVLNVSGHRMGTAEIESSLVEHAAVSEAAVVGYPHNIKGQGIYAYVTLKEGYKESAELAKELQRFVREDIGAIAKPDRLQFSPSLPKTRSGKIMRRILRKIAAGDTQNFGDTSTLADPAVVEDLLKQKAYGD